jgi:hypothetical protein
MAVLNRWRILVLALLSLLAGAAVAQSSVGSGTVMVLPLVAQTGTFSTEVTVRNFNLVPITVNVTFYEGFTHTYPPNPPEVPTSIPHVCTALALAANQTKQFSLNTQCPGLDATSHFGFLLMEDGAAQKVNSFSALSRTDNYQGFGFNVEAFPIGTFSGAVAGSLGLKRLAPHLTPPIRPAYDSNCFVASLGESVNYRIQLRDATSDAQVGADIEGTLGPWQLIRYLDIFRAANSTGTVPVGDLVGVRARFDDLDAGEPAYVGFCTVQENSNFSADFRIARSNDGEDNSQLRFLCYGQNPCGTIDPVAPTQILDAANKLIHQTFIRAPDYIKCTLVSPRLADLEMRIRGPGDAFLSPVWPSVPPFSSGGDNQTSFYIYTGPRGAVNGGFATRWFIDVGFREGGNATFPIDYGITCTSGNGMMIPWVRSRTTDDF